MSDKSKAVDAYLSTIGVAFKVQGGMLTKRDNWKCFAWQAQFARAKKAPLDAPYYTGTAHVHKLSGSPTKPSAADLLYSLLLDGTAIDQSFDDWCSDMGADNDSLKALNTYQRCCEIGKQLHVFFSAAERAEIAKLLEDY